MSFFHENMLLGSSGQGGAAGYQIERSIRLNSADSAHLSRTPASAGNRKTWTWAGWVKKTFFGFGFLFSCTTGTSDATFTRVGFNNDRFCLSGYTGNYRVSTALFRDPSAWYHFVCSVDTTQATAANRVKLYVNGQEITSFAENVNPSQNADLGINQATVHEHARSNGGDYYSGYLADIHFIDGQALTPTSFGEFDTNNVWQPKAYTGTYGTNGFRLDFSDNSAATATTLGKDRAGSNNWTPNNLSVTAGAGNDSLVDSPTNYGTDTGVGGSVRGNYCTWNPLATQNTLANGSLDISQSGVSDYRGTLGTFGMSSGKWYWEYTSTLAPNSSNVAYVGISGSGVPLNLLYGGVVTNYIYQSNSGQKRTPTESGAYGDVWTTSGDIIGIAFNADNGTLTFYKNGVSQGVAFSSIPAGVYLPSIATYAATSVTGVVNFGQRPFAYTAPSGFKALCTQNLPTPTITNGATAMDAVLYTGTGSTLTPTSTLGFSPDLVWIKSRSAATNHSLYDAVRGTQTRLESNTTGADVTSDNGLTAFNSNGFTLGTLAQVNTNAATYAAWAWDAGSSTVTNNSGTISSQVRASTSNGFSVVTYTGIGANATVGHGLGVAPQLIFVKCRNVVRNWNIYSAALGATQYIQFTTAAAVTLNTLWNNTAPTSTVFSLGTSVGVNGSTETHVAYCWAPVAGYSAFGSYTGNGLADGPFVYTGFRPKFLLVKLSSGSVDNWFVQDTSRSPFNVSVNTLLPDATNTEQTGTFNSVDILSNGFKLRDTNQNFNGSGYTYIYACFAENPFALARAR